MLIGSIASIVSLAGRGEVTHEVSDVQAPRDGERDRQDLEPEELVESQRLGESIALAQEERRLLAADRDDRDDVDPFVHGKANEALAAGEVDPAALRGGPVDLPVTAGIYQQRTS